MCFGDFHCIDREVRYRCRPFSLRRPEVSINSLGRPRDDSVTVYSPTSRSKDGSTSYSHRR